MILIIVELIVSDLVNGCQTDIDSVIIRTIVTLLLTLQYL